MEGSDLTRRKRQGTNHDPDEENEPNMTENTENTDNHAKLTLPENGDKEIDNRLGEVENTGDGSNEADEDTHSETNGGYGYSTNRTFLEREGTCYIPKRYIVTFLLGMGMLLIYAMRTNIGVTVVMILDKEAHMKVETLEAFINLPRLNWDSQMVGFLHSVFYIGFIITQIPGAHLTTSFPSHKMFGVCVLVSSLLNLLLPVCIQNSQYVVTCAVRCCQGMAEGLLYPACYAILRHWSAPSERSRQVSTVWTCGYAGTILGFPVAGVITNYVGWQYVFYLSGGVCTLWFLFWLCLVYEKPSHHKFISEQEFDFMQKSQGYDAIDYEDAKVPWKAIISSLPVLAICFCHFTRQWVFILMLTNEPLFLNEFGFNIAQTGLYASIPHMAKVLLSCLSGITADCLLNGQAMSTTAVRKLLTGVGLGVQSVCFLVISFLRDGMSIIIVLTVALGAFGLSTSGWSVNHYDLSTRHASSLVAVTSTFGNIGSIIVPLVTGALTVNQDLEGWAQVFYLTSAVVAVSVIFFLGFGSGDQQPWANPPGHLNLVQKTDPLALKPYKLMSLSSQKKSSDEKMGLTSNESRISTAITQQQLMQKLSD